MDGSDCVMLLVAILLALVFCVLPVLAVANPSMVNGLIIGVTLSFIIGFIAVALILRNGR